MRTSRRASRPAGSPAAFRASAMGWAIIATLALCVAAARGAAAGSPPVVKIVSGPKCVEGEPATDTSVAITQGVTFTARPMKTEEWEERLNRRAPGQGGLFRGHGGSPAPFQAFLVKVENKNPALVRFQPGNIVLIGGKNEEDHILDYTDLYRYLEGIGKSGDDLDSVRDEFFDSGMILEDARPVEKIVFFHALPPDKKRKAMALLFSSFQVGTETYQAGLAWHFEKVQ